MLDAAREVVASLPPDEVSTCVLDADGGLLRADASQLSAALRSGRVRFHRGSIRGSLPRLVDAEIG